MDGAIVGVKCVGAHQGGYRGGAGAVFMTISTEKVQPSTKGWALFSLIFCQVLTFPTIIIFALATLSAFHSAVPEFLSGQVSRGLIDLVIPLLGFFIQLVLTILVSFDFDAGQKRWILWQTITMIIAILLYLFIFFGFLLLGIINDVAIGRKPYTVGL